MANLRIDRDQLARDRLTPEDWSDLVEMAELLEPFRRITLDLQWNPEDAGQGCIVDVVPGMEFLLDVLEDARLRHATETTHFAQPIDCAWAKLDQYYTFIDRCPAYVVSIFLDPHCKFEYFETHWQSRPDWVTGAKEKIVAFCESYYDAETDDSVDALFTSQSTTDSALESWKYGSRKGKEKEGYTVRGMEVDVYVARGVDRSEQAATLNLHKYWMA